MCYSCWQEYGAPAIRNAKTERIALLAEAIYEYDPVGGNLHIHLDDWNIDDEFFEKFVVYDARVSDVQLAVEQECFTEMQAATLEERASGLAIWNKFIEAATT